MQSTIPIKKSNVISSCLFFGVFAVAGLIAFYFLGYKLFKEYFQAKNWNALPCVVTQSNLEQRQSKDSGNALTHKINIRYQYQFQNKKYIGHRYHFIDAYSTEERSKWSIVRAYPQGKHFTCYVNPQDPTQSVINRGLGGYFLWSLFSIPFFLIGVGGIYKTLNPDKESVEKTDPDGPMTLKQATPLQKLLLAAAACLFWNGIVAIFIVNWIHQYGSIQFIPLMTLLFISPFIFVGLLLGFQVLVQFLALFNPKVEITLNQNYLKIGGRYTLNYQFNGNIQRLSGFSISLVGKEKVTYRQGKGSNTDECIIFKALIYTQSQQISPQQEIEFTIPENIMPSFKSTDNEIEWTIAARGKIVNWPDINNEYTIQIHPNH